MTSANEQIVVAYEENNLSPEQIAEQLEYDVTAVKAILFQNSSIYRKDSKQDDTLQFTQNEAEEMKSIILSLARYAEDEHLKFKCAKYVRDDKLGRLDNPLSNNGLNQFNFNIVNFNAQLQKALEAQKRTLTLTEKKVVDVSS